MFGGKIMKKNKLFKRILVLSILCIILIPLTSKAFSTSSTNKTSYSKITVCSGDTLWTIASENIGSGGDIREFVYNIRKVNNLDSAIITPGQELLIPN
jgi:LysM repeat protein